MGIAGEKSKQGKMPRIKRNMVPEEEFESTWYRMSRWILRPVRIVHLFKFGENPLQQNLFCELLDLKFILDNLLSLNCVYIIEQYDNIVLL